MTRPLRAILLCLLAALALFAGACGSGSGSEASSDTDVDTLLADTFDGEGKKFESGKLDLKLTLDTENTEGTSTPVSLRITGPFKSEGKQKLPKFKLDAVFAGAGQSIKAGLTSTGSKGFVNLQGSDYAVSDQIFKQFKTSYEQAQKSGNTEDQSLSSLGLDPRTWLTNARNEGDAKVGDVDTIKITGGVDVNKLLDDVNKLLTQASELGAQGTESVPSRLTAAQRKQIIDAVKDPKVEIYTGKEDTSLRRMVVALGIAATDSSSSSSGSSAFKLDLSISELNEDQEISEPSNPKPFDELLSQLGALGLGSSGDASGSGSGSGSGSNDADLDEYSKCVNDAGSDTTKARECADLL